LRRGRGFTLIELLVVIVIIAALATMVVTMVDRSREDAEQTVARASMKAIAEAINGSAAGTGYLGDMKHVPGFRSVNLRVHDLLSPSSHPENATYDPAAARGWRGPYLRPGTGAANAQPSRRGLFPEAGDRREPGDATFLDRGFFTSAGTSPYGLPGDLTMGDPWGNPFVIQTPTTMAFANPTGDAKRFRYSRLVSAGADGILTTPADRLAGLLIDGTSAVRGDDLVLFLNRADVYEIEEP
jgi:prepilin-type N-terminal cleavage/methylation domain-containing protein